MHYKIKVLIISRFNYYEIMLINCLLIICNTYRVNKLIEAKLDLEHLSEKELENPIIFVMAHGG